MQKTVCAGLGVSRLAGVALSIALVVALAWAASAQAQTPTEDQYGGPSVPSGPALGPSGVAVEGGDTTTGDDNTTGGTTAGGTAAGGNAAGNTAVDGAATGGSATGNTAAGNTAAGGNATGGGSQPAGSVAGVDVLPATGGVPLLVYAGALAASGAGLLVLLRRGVARRGE